MHFCIFTCDEDQHRAFDILKGFVDYCQALETRQAEIEEEARGQQAGGGVTFLEGQHLEPLTQEETHVFNRWMNYWSAVEIKYELDYHHRKAVRWVDPIAHYLIVVGFKEVHWDTDRGVIFLSGYRIVSFDPQSHLLFAEADFWHQLLHTNLSEM